MKSVIFCEIQFNIEQDDDVFVLTGSHVRSFEYEPNDISMLIRKSEVKEVVKGLRKLAQWLESNG